MQPPPPPPLRISRHTTAAAFLESTLQSPHACTLLICSARDVFRASLSAPFAAQLPTLATLRAAQDKAVVFLPSILHVRAYVSSLAAASAGAEEGPAAAAAELRVWGAIHAHRDSTEFSAQGVGRTLGALVDAVRHRPRRWTQLVIAEHGHDWWRTNLPVLNASVRQESLGVVAGRTLALRGLLERWFVFEMEVDGEDGDSSRIGEDGDGRRSDGQ